MEYMKLKEYWLSEEKKSFKGWDFSNFSVDSCFKQLCLLQSIVEDQGFVESKEHRFVIVARKSNLAE